jgi:hypothetical protein
MTMKAALLAAALALATVTLPIVTVSAMPQFTPGLAGTDAVSHVEKAYWHRLASPSLASQMVMSQI